MSLTTLLCSSSRLRGLCARPLSLSPRSTSSSRYQVTDTEARRIALEFDIAAVWERTSKDETWWKNGEDTGEWS